MILNKNIRFIIYTYYTYTDSMIEEFKEEWKRNIKKVNNIIKLSNNNFALQNSCCICDTNEHFNWECPRFYYTMNLINTLKIN